MNDFEKVIRVLERHISPIHARSVLNHAASEHRVAAHELKLAHLPKLNSALARGLRLFLNENDTDVALQAVVALNTRTKSGSLRVESATIEIATEADISRARNAARAMCEQLGAKGYSIQKITTIVSELARNIVSYSMGGKVELLFNPVPTERIVIRAIDRGPGITNLDHVLSGQYRSKTGLGRGLLGSKRLSDHFEITTGPAGSNILCEVRL
ncbi:MAG TPA: ATP-binding protein [Polyangiales bacterium]|nr:ATP-binding protein [Polyangiales bacterium]